MDGTDLAIPAVAVLGYAVVSGRLRGTVVTPAMVFVGVGLAVGGNGLGWIDVEFSVSAVQALTTATLTLVLFTDALRIDVPALRQEIDLPRRLLGVGLPLTILAGTGAAVLLFDELSLWPARRAGDRAGTDRRRARAGRGHGPVACPSRIRQGLNVESGLNDGLCVPLLAIFLTLAESEEGAGPWRGASGWSSRRSAAAWSAALVAGAVGGAPSLREADPAPAGSSRRWHAIALVAVPARGLRARRHAPAAAASSPPSWPGWCSGGCAGREGLPTELADELGEAAGRPHLPRVRRRGPRPGRWATSPGRWSVYALLSLTVVRMLPVAVSLVGTNPRPADGRLRRLVRPAGPGVDRLRPRPGGGVRTGRDPPDRDRGRPDGGPQRPACTGCRRRPAAGPLRPVVHRPTAGPPTSMEAGTGDRGPPPGPAPAPPE